MTIKLETSLKVFSAKQEKSKVSRIISGAVFTTLFTVWNLRMGPIS
jgi:hypothetical protein